MVYYYLGRTGNGEEVVYHGAGLNPNDYNTHYNLGELFYSKYEDNGSALTNSKKTLEATPCTRRPTSGWA